MQHVIEKVSSAKMDRINPYSIKIVSTMKSNKRCPTKKSYLGHFPNMDRETFSEYDVKEWDEIYTWYFINNDLSD